MLCLLTAMVDSPEDKRKIEQLYEKYHRLMFSVAFQILRHKEDAEDAVFHAWERIIKNLNKIDEIDCKKTKSFLVIITERISIDHYRKKSRREEVFSESPEESPYFITREKDFETIETMGWLRSLPKKYSEVLILYYVNGLSLKEIAEILDLKQNSVASRLSRGRKMLAEKGDDVT